MRDTHKPLTGGPFYPPIQTLKTSVTRCERFFLWFVKRQYKQDPENPHVTIVYKIFNKKIYVIDIFLPPPIHFNCRCKIVEK